MGDNRERTLLSATLFDDQNSKKEGKVVMEGGGWRKKVKDDSRRYTWKQNHKVGENSSVCKWKDNFFLCFTLAILALRQ